MEHVSKPDLVADPHAYMDALPEAERLYLEGLIAGFWDAAEDYEYEFVDSGRLACVTDGPEIVAFDESRSCCGSHEETFGPSPAGRSYAWGFNHGHSPW